MSELDMDMVSAVVRLIWAVIFCFSMTAGIIENAIRISWRSIIWTGNYFEYSERINENTDTGVEWWEELYLLSSEDALVLIHPKEGI